MKVDYGGRFGWWRACDCAYHSVRVFSAFPAKIQTFPPYLFEIQFEISDDDDDDDDDDLLSLLLL